MTQSQQTQLPPDPPEISDAEAHEIVQWFLSGIRITSPKMGGDHYWRFWSPSLVGPTALEAIRREIARTHNSQPEAS